MDSESEHEEGTSVESSASGLNKRLRSTSTFLTPTQRPKRAPLREVVVQSQSSSSEFLAPRQLSYDQCTSVARSSGKWTDAEIKALIEFILFHSTGDVWPCHKQMLFWNNAGHFVQRRSGTDTCRSGMQVIF